MEIFHDLVRHAQRALWSGWKARRDARERDRTDGVAVYVFALDAVRRQRWPAGGMRSVSCVKRLLRRCSDEHADDLQGLAAIENVGCGAVGQVEPGLF